MKHIIITIIQLLSIILTSKAQEKSICEVKYKDLKTSTILGTYNYWFLKDKLISSNEPNLKKIYMGGFPVLTNGVMTTQTDTVKYNRQFNEFIDDIKTQMKNKKERVVTKEYNSDILKTSIFLDDVNKNFIVVDTLKKMDNWEVVEDTLTLMGYKCQKAIINYKQEKYYAWFTAELPYNAGPAEFRGLPGLILKVSNFNENQGFEAIEILTPFKGFIPKFDDVGVIISQNEWMAIAAESRKKSREASENRRKQLQKERQNQSINNTGL